MSKSLLKSRYTTVAALSLALQPVISSGKTVMLVRHDLPLVNWCWLFPISFSYFMWLQKTLRSSQWLGWDCPARSSLDFPFHTSWRLLPHPYFVSIWPQMRTFSRNLTTTMSHTTLYSESEFMSHAIWGSVTASDGHRRLPIKLQALEVDRLKCSQNMQKSRVPILKQSHEDFRWWEHRF